MYAHSWKVHLMPWLAEPQRAQSLEYMLTWEHSFFFQEDENETAASPSKSECSRVSVVNLKMASS